MLSRSTWILVPVVMTSFILAACGGGGRVIKPAPVIPQPEEPEPEAHFALSIAPTFEDSRVCRFTLEWNEVLAAATNENGAQVPEGIVLDADGDGALVEQELDLKYATEGEEGMSVLSFVLEYPAAGVYTAVATAHAAEKEFEVTATVSVEEPSAIKPEDVFPPDILDPEDYEYHDIVMGWSPERGEGIEIWEGMVHVRFSGPGVGFGAPVFDSPDYETVSFDEESERFRQRGTFQCLIDLGFEPFDEPPFTCYLVCPFDLPHYLTFEEAHLVLTGIFDEIALVIPQEYSAKQPTRCQSRTSVDSVKRSWH